MLRLIAFAAVALVLAVAGCDRSEDTRAALARHDVPGGNARQGRKLIARIGCGECHSIPGVRRAHDLVGPPLDNIADRMIIAGMLANTPNNMVAWLRSPQSVVPGNAMPDLGLSPGQARDVAAYLYTLR